MEPQEPSGRQAPVKIVGVVLVLAGITTALFFTVRAAWLSFFPTRIGPCPTCLEEGRQLGSWKLAGGDTLNSAGGPEAPQVLEFLTAEARELQESLWEGYRADSPFVEGEVLVDDVPCRYGISNWLVQQRIRVLVGEGDSEVTVLQMPIELEAARRKRADRLRLGGYVYERD